MSSISGLPERGTSGGNGNKSGIFCTLQVGRQKEDSDAVHDGKYPVWKNEFEFYLIYYFDALLDLAR